MNLPRTKPSFLENIMGINLLIGVEGIIVGVGLVFAIRGKDGPRFLRNSAWLIVYPTLPLLFFTIGGAWPILALT
jgi:hypothetical protein